MTSASLARSGADPNRTISALERYPELAGPDRIEAELARHWHAVADRQPDSALLAAWRAANAAFRSLAYAERFEQLGRVLELRERAPDAAGRLGVDRLTVVEEAIVAAGFTRADARALDLADADPCSTAAAAPTASSLAAHRAPAPATCPIL